MQTRRDRLVELAMRQAEMVSVLEQAIDEAETLSEDERTDLLKFLAAGSKSDTVRHGTREGAPGKRERCVYLAQPVQRKLRSKLAEMGIRSIRHFDICGVRERAAARVSVAA